MKATSWRSRKAAMQRALNRLREALLLVSLPLILLATIYVLSAVFWLLVIALAGWTHRQGLLLLPAIYTVVPTGLWDTVHLAPLSSLPPGTVAVLQVGTGWPAESLAFLHQAGLRAIHASALPVIAGALLWLFMGYRHQNLWNAIALKLDTLPPGAAPWLEDQLRALAQAARLPVPRLSIWNSPAPNAFASGLNAATYKITVTTGLIQSLSPRELNAVLAHELGHIRAGDVRLLTLCYVYGGSFSAVADYLWLNVLHSLRGDNTIYNRLLFSLPLAALAALVFSLAGGMATLVRSLLLRGREIQADRFSARLTDDASALSTALAKIGAYEAPPPLQRLIRDSVIHAPAKSWWRRLTATHPSMESAGKPCLGKKAAPARAIFLPFCGGFC